MTENVIITRDRHIVQIRLNRPQKKNAMSLDCYETVAQTVEQAESDDSVRAIVILGSGGNFCAGHDLTSSPIEASEDGPTPPSRLMISLINSSVPIVAGVEGVAVGIGATILLQLDSVVAEPEARILMPFVNLALVPEAGSSLLLPRMLGYTRAAEYLMRSKPITGQRAYELGIVSTLAEPGQVEATALEIAGEFASKPPGAMRKTKRLLQGDRQVLLDRVSQEEGLLFECSASAEAAEAVAAFMEKRPPDYSNLS
jgi:enoyl-CoA hydratase/carnithine racemase